MEEYWEFRVNEHFAHLLFGPTEGVRLGETIRKIRLARTDPRFDQIPVTAAAVKQQYNRGFFFGWEPIYEYSSVEIGMAELFHLNIWARFEPTGAECGTQYDYSEACPECGIPRKQTSDLILDLRKAPKSKDIAETIAGDEWIVTQRLAELLVDAKLTGFDLQRVRHKAQYMMEPVDLEKVPSGRELLLEAEKVGFQHGTVEYYNWVNRPEQNELWERALAETIERKTIRARKRGTTPPAWYQLIVASKPVSCVAPTRFGVGPFDDDPEGRFRCPYGHIAGLNLLSEISVERSDWDGSDLCCTHEHTGYVIPVAKRNPETTPVISPSPMLLMSPRFREVLVKNKIKGWSSDVAYLK